MNHYWWQTGIIFQVYPRSFQDSNSDGIGDINGIIRRLDYLECLGIKAIWISPIYPSPMNDFGYDITDYKNIDPVFGTLEDFDELHKQVHSRGIKLLMDFVHNHTSSLHPWFLESRSSRENPKRDWYMWYDPLPDGGPPNNWLSVFGGIAWEWDEQTGQYYYHSFLKEQPDLNWRNPEVREAMYDNMRFWLDRGIDGFRIDVIWHLIKDKQLRDNPKNPLYEEHTSTYEQLLPVYSTDQPEVHEIVEEMRAIHDQYGDHMMIGEIYLPIHRLVTYYGATGKGAHLPFNFTLISLPWQAQKIAMVIDEYESALPENAWPNWVISNHDQPRITSRVGVNQSKVAAMLLLTLRGTPTLYYGDKIGMRDVAMYRLPWGDAINYDDAWSDGVREYFSCNPTHWYLNYHLDGLRIDAVHTIFDSGAVHFWELVHGNIKKAENKHGRKFWLIAESDFNSPKIVRHPEAGGYGFDSQWLDDFHHSLYVLLHPEGRSRYEDFGLMEQLAKAYTDGFVHSGEYVKFRKRKHGSSSRGLPGERFIAFNQNHDQIGNRVLGERLCMLTGFRNKSCFMECCCLCEKK